MSTGASWAQVALVEATRACNENAHPETLFDLSINAVAVCVNARLGLVIRRCVQSLAYVVVLNNKLSAVRAALFTDAQALP